MNKAQTRILSHSVMCNESNEDDTEETTDERTKSTQKYSCVVLVSVHVLQDCGHVKHVVVLVVMRIRVINSIRRSCSHVFTFQLYVNFL